MELPFEDVLEFVTLIFHARFGPDTITEDQLREFTRVYHEIIAKAYRDAKPVSYTHLDVYTRQRLFRIKLKQEHICLP